ncbi:universally conserved protein [Hyperthermus butylicus DSM 5456]|uniref:Universally conserved protein n=1 Tax=Hyperthermus butylicus (strain DSM 5456 / JCM 9403 / PLM1-5) TaxID=415426 RepID=A2BML0_HYPBU|nr:universally conserved protein [Hyperthermus butylicus DSM 5456]
MVVWVLRGCLVYLASPIHQQEYVSWLRYTFKTFLLHAGVSVKDRGLATSPEEAARLVEGCNYVVAVVATGGSEELILSVVKAARGAPVLIVAQPYANSLPAALEAYPLLRGGNTALVFLDSLDPSSVGAVRKLRSAVAGLRGAAKLRSARIGLIGEPSPWLVYSRTTLEKLRERLGAILVRIEMEELYELMDRAEPSEELVERIYHGAAAVDVPRGRVPNALRVYLALRSIVEKHRLDAVTVECFRLIKERGTTACLALSLLNSEGVVAGCEADVPSTVTMLLLHTVSAGPVFMGNPSIVKGDKLMIAHCTAPIAMGRRYTLHSHFESGLGVGISIQLEPGTRVTIARFDPEFRVLRVGRGVVEESGLLSRLHCRTQLWIRLDGNAERIVEESIGNHYVVALGDHVDALRAAASILGSSLDIL